MKNKPLVSVIIVNWNGGNVFRDCLLSLSKINYPNWELIVVDNGSTDSSLDYLKTPNLPKSKIILNKKNVGFAKANNQGYEESLGEYILLLNNDTQVQSNLIAKLLERLQNDPEIGVIQPKIYIMDNPDYLDNAGSFMTQIGFLEHWGFEKKDSEEFSKERIIFSAKGACMLIKRSVIEKVGLFDPDFVSYFEESDFCWRVWLAGWKVLFYPEVSIHHKVGFTSKRMYQIEVNARSIKNRITTLYKNLSIINLFYILLPHLIIVTGLGFYYLFTLQPRKYWMVASALGKNLVEFPLLTKKRLKVQKLRVRSDSEIFSQTMHKVNLSRMFTHFRRVETNYS
jgi:hypothetical protein